MKLSRRSFLHFASGATALPSSRASLPRKPIRRARAVIVPFGSAGATDIVARLIGQFLSERLGQPFVIENRPGAGSNLGIEAVVRAPADGYTLLLAGTPAAANVSLYDKLSYNFIRDIAPVAGLIRFPNVLLVNPSIPATTIPELVAYAKANPGKLNMATPGSGSAPHLAGELFKMMTGIDMVHVPYRSTAAVMTDLLSGQVQVFFATTASSTEFVRAGAVRALAVTTATRSEVLPDIPTMRNLYRATSRPHGTASAYRAIRLPRSSISSTRRSTLCSPIHSEGEVHRSRRRRAPRHACRLRKARRGRNR